MVRKDSRKMTMKIVGVRGDGAEEVEEVELVRASAH
jgi:hypothetical protein